LAAFSSAPGSDIPKPWRFVGLPERYAKPPTAFDLTDLDGQRVLRVKTDKSYGNLVYDIALGSPIAQAHTLKWRWRLDAPLLQADLSNKKTEDVAIKLCVSFDMPVANIPGSERALFRFAQFVSRDKLPTATLCYIWAHKEPVGSVLQSPYTGRVRYLVIDSGVVQLKSWQAHERNTSADFLKAFGEEIPTVPAQTAIIIGADADNSLGMSLGYVGDIQLKP
jgi:hypothetical protein